MPLQPPSPQLLARAPKLPQPGRRPHPNPRSGDVFLMAAATLAVAAAIRFLDRRWQPFV